MPAKQPCSVNLSFPILEPYLSVSFPVGNPGLPPCHHADIPGPADPQNDLSTIQSIGDLLKAPYFLAVTLFVSRDFRFQSENRLINRERNHKMPKNKKNVQN